MISRSSDEVLLLISILEVSYFLKSYSLRVFMNVARSYDMISRRNVARAVVLVF